ncbi:MAG: hypothetical protein ACREK6_01930 [Candidatus Rokuibacteriota bacterium]
MMRLGPGAPTVLATGPATEPHCAYCGRRIEADTPAIDRFGEQLCSETHAEHFAESVRVARIEAAARREETAGRAPTATVCSLPPAGQRTWRDTLRRGACWGAPLLLLLAMPLFWSGSSLWSGGSLGAVGGSLLSVLALLACPLGMYLMMRAMGGMQHGGSREDETSRARPASGSASDGGR